MEKTIWTFIFENYTLNNEPFYDNLFMQTKSCNKGVFLYIEHFHRSWVFCLTLKGLYDNSDKHVSMNCATPQRYQCMWQPLGNTLCKPCTCIHIFLKTETQKDPYRSRAYVCQKGASNISVYFYVLMVSR